VRGYPGLWSWAFAVWLLLSATFDAEQLLFGAGIAALVAVALAPLGPGRGPWWLLYPARLWALTVLCGVVAGKVVLANVRLALRVWRPSIPLRSGMLVVSTTRHSVGSLAAVGVLTSLIVDNQLVDLDRANGELQYHAVELPRDERERAEVNSAVERSLTKLTDQARWPRGRAARTEGGDRGEDEVKG
jgi:multicomponent Na+:H+ antiporter subunit E